MASYTIGEPGKEVLARLPGQHIMDSRKRLIRPAVLAVAFSAEDRVIGKGDADALRPALHVPASGGDKESRLGHPYSRTAATCATFMEKAAAISARV